MKVGLVISLLTLFLACSEPVLQLRGHSVITPCSQVISAELDSGGTIIDEKKGNDGRIPFSTTSISTEIYDFVSVAKVTCLNTFVFRSIDFEFDGDDRDSTKIVYDVLLPQLQLEYGTGWTPSGYIGEGRLHSFSCGDSGYIGLIELFDTEDDGRNKVVIEFCPRCNIC